MYQLYTDLKSALK